MSVPHRDLLSETYSCIVYSLEFYNTLIDRECMAVNAEYITLTELC